MADGFLRVQPAGTLVVAQRDKHRPRDGFLGDAGLFLHPPQYEPARRGRGDVEEVALGIVAEQLDPEPRMQPALAVLAPVEPTRLAAIGRLVRHDVFQLPLPRLPAARRAPLAQDHRDRDAGAVAHRNQVFLETVMVGNFAEKSLDLAATFTAICRATAL